MAIGILARDTGLGQGPAASVAHITSVGTGSMLSSMVSGKIRHLSFHAGQPRQGEIQGDRASGPMTRSTEESEMSRSCQSATFSNAGITVIRTSRARPGQGSRQGPGSSCAAWPSCPFCPMAKGTRPLPAPRCAHVADLDAMFSMLLAMTAERGNKNICVRGRAGSPG